MEYLSTIAMTAAVNAVVDHFLKRTSKVHSDNIGEVLLSPLKKYLGR